MRQCGPLAIGEPPTWLQKCLQNAFLGRQVLILQQEFLFDQTGNVGPKAAPMWLCSSSASIIEDRDPSAHLDILTIRDGWRRVALDEGIPTSEERLAGLLALDDALSLLAKLHPRQSDVIELRYFGGLSVEETAAILQVSAETVMLDWRAAKAWLHKELAQSHDT